MRPHGFAIALTVLLLLVSTPGWSQSDPVQPPPEATLRKRVLALLDKEKYEELDELAAQFRRTKERNKNSTWKLQEMYAGFDVRPGPKQTNTAPSWERREAQLRKWVAERTNSITARVALAQHLIDHGWDVRGSDVASKVTEAGWKSFGEQLREAKSVLDEARKLPTRCPEWYAAMLTLAMGQGWEQSRYDQLFDEAFAFEPGYHAFCDAKALRLLPRWGGNKGDVGRFARDMAERTKPEFGDAYYLRIAHEVMRVGEPLKDAGLDWERIKQAGRELLKAYPEADYWQQSFALMAVQAKDRKTTREEIQKITGRPDMEIWGTAKFYRECQAWAIPQAGKGKKKK